MPAPTMQAADTFVVTLTLPTVYGDTTMQFEYSAAAATIEADIALLAEKVEDLTDLVVSGASYSKRLTSTDRSQVETAKRGATIALIQGTLEDGESYTFTIPEPEPGLIIGGVSLAANSNVVQSFLSQFVSPAKWKISDGEQLLSIEYTGKIADRKRR